MSHHVFETTHQNRPLKVLLGFDRPLQRFFMVLTYQDDIPEPIDDEETWDDGVLYNNIYDSEAIGGMNRYQAVLQEQGLTIPDSMIRNVLEDGANNVGNKYVVYQADGSWTEPYPIH